jgi:hypothetical protein
MLNINVSWATFKAHAIDLKKYSFQDIVDVDGVHNLIAGCMGITLTCRLKEDAEDADWVEYSTGGYLERANSEERQPVTTQFETRDKTLRSMCAFAESDSSGVVTFAVPIPSEGGGRWIAYGDSEFEVRHFQDRVVSVRLMDLDGIIPEEMRSAFPEWPKIGYFEEDDFPDPMPENAKGTISGGMAMTFQYGMTEMSPIGGYAWAPSGFYLEIILKKDPIAPALPGKSEGDQSGYRASLTVDWAENDNA